VNQKREAYQQAYFDALEQLNRDQRQAVDQIEGPVMVIAGPGTGKTHILAARIGRILLETDAMAHNVLCLTFTDAGVHAMRERLLSFIGPEAHRVHIFTFHSFCNRIIQENMELFGRQDLEPISELERVEMIRALLEELEPHTPCAGARPTFIFMNRIWLICFSA
jgi:DNA helicase-2/ATP-dependent DNA helicase PcrA